MPQDHVPERGPGDPRLAMVTADGSVAVRAIGPIPSDDSAPIVVADALAERLTFGWPCWSPDGGALLVSGSGHDADGAARLEVQRVTPDGSEPPAVVFRNDSDSPGVIAQGIAHYMCWSPSGRIAAIVAQSRKGLMLSLADARRSAPAQALMAGGPLYFAWAPDSRALAIHLAMDLLLFDTRFRGSPSDASGSQRIAHDVPTFRTPAWTRAGDGVLYTTPNASEGVTVWKSARDGESREAVTTLPGPHALVRAPRSDLIAAVPVLGEGSTPRAVTILTPEGAAETIATGPLASVHWAPDSSALFFIGPVVGEPELTVSRIELESGTIRQLARFRPSVEFATMLGFYDQYAQSHGLVSPDGRFLTFAGVAANNGGGGRPGLAPQNGCYVVPTDGSSAARRVGNGDIAFFPPAGSVEGPVREPERFRSPPPLI